MHQPRRDADAIAHTLVCAPDDPVRIETASRIEHCALVDSKSREPDNRQPADTLEVGRDGLSDPVPDPVIFGCTGDVSEDDDGYAVASLWTRGPTGLLGGDGSRPTDAQGGYSPQDGARVDDH